MAWETPPGDENRIIEPRNHHHLLGITTKHEIKIGTHEEPPEPAWNHDQVLEEK